MLLLLFATGAEPPVGGDEGPYPGGVVKAEVSRIVIEAAVWRRD